MTRLKIMTVVGTRPEVIRLSRLIPKLDELTNHILVHTGQNFDHNLNQVFFEELGLRDPDSALGVDTSTVANSLAGVLIGVEKQLLEHRPDAVMILGDTNSAISAVVAERLGIPVYHMEAGNRSFDKNVPEELNRRLVDHISSFNLPYNSYAKTNLLAEGIHPRGIFVTGSPIREIVEYYANQIEGSEALQNLGLEPKEYFLASFHRQENVDDSVRLDRIVRALELLTSRWNVPVIVSTHPRTRSKLASSGSMASSMIRFMDPFGFFAYSKLQKNALCVLSDSGSISEESAIMNFPAVSLRDSIERPESIDYGSTVLASTDPDAIMRNVSLALTRNDPIGTLPDGYEVTDFSERVLNVLFSTVEQHAFWNGLRPTGL